MGRLMALRLAGIVAGLAVLAARGDEPLVISPEVMKSFEEYKQQKKPLYFAVSADGLYSWYIYCPERQCDMTRNYRRLAIDGCEKSGGSDCRILAVGSEIQVDYRVGDPAAMTPAPAKTAPCGAAEDESDAAAVAAVARLNPRACGNYRAYRNYEHFKAFAGADIGSPRGTWSWASRHKTAQEVVKSALDECEAGRKEFSVAAQCRLFAIGDIVVDGMGEAELRRAVAAYQQDRDATNADLTTGL